MFKKIVVHLKYPHAAMIILTLWLGTAFLVSIDSQLPITYMLVINTAATIYIAYQAFK